MCGCGLRVDGLAHCRFIPRLHNLFAVGKRKASLHQIDDFSKDVAGKTGEGRVYYKGCVCVLGKVDPFFPPFCAQMGYVNFE